MQKHVTNVVEFLNNHYTIKERSQLLTRTRCKFSGRFKVRHKKGAQKNDPRFIYLRLRVAGGSAPDFSTGVSCLLEEWDQKAQKIRGYSDKVAEKNRQLSQILEDIHTMFNDLRQKGVNVTAQMLKDFYRSKNNVQDKSLVSYFKMFMSWHESSICKETFRSWRVHLSVLTDYLIETRQLNVGIEAINGKWALHYFQHLTQVRKLHTDYAARKVFAVSKVLDYAILQDDLDFNPLKALKLPKAKPKPIKYLNEAEIEKLQNCPFYNARLSNVVDCFLFQCFTGMAYHELVKFNVNEHLKTDTEGQEWIKIRRGKTNTLSLIPLLPQAKDILNKYESRLPIISNQKMNAFIKEAAQMAGLNHFEEIGTHVARKTCGTFLLNRGIPIEAVSRVLGHTSVKVTQTFYAELLTSTIKQNFKNSGLI